MGSLSLNLSSLPIPRGLHRPAGAPVPPPPSPLAGGSPSPRATPPPSTNRPPSTPSPGSSQIWRGTRALGGWRHPGVARWGRRGEGTRQLGGDGAVLCRGGHGLLQQSGGGSRVCRVGGQRISRGKFAVAAITLDDYLPMRSTEVKNRTSTDGIKSVRLITAVKTPYLPDGRFDLEAYDSLINTQIDGGAEGVIVGGTTGEGHLMSWDEHIMLIGHTVNCFGTNIKVIGNTGSNSTREAVHATEQGFAVGMHAALHVNPYYGKTSTEGLISHFEAVLPMGPTIIYNVPSRTGQDIPPPVIEAISRYSNMAGVKECVGHERVKCYTDKGITIWSGNDDECHDSRWKYGATGVISVASNLAPGLMHSLMYEGENVVLNEKLLPLMKWLFCQPNPIGLNTALAQLGVVRPVFRLPYVPLPLEKRIEFVRIVESIGRENFVGQKEARVLDDDDFVLISRY